jgi:AraC-like DNA-binding protein
MPALSVIESPTGGVPLAIAALGRRPAGEAALSVLNQLLTDAVLALDRDREGARQALSRAVALLEAEQDLGLAEENRSGLAFWQVRKALAHIDDRLEFTIRICELASLTRLSKSYFSRAFKMTFGLSPQKYIVTRRIARAQQIMLTTNEPLCDIARACGFSDQAHLSRVFRRLTGKTPNAWRRARRVVAAPRAWNRLRAT